MDYIGEHLLPGQIGHLLAVLSFVAALLSSIAYFWATQKRATPDYEGWRNLGRFGFLLHGLTTFGVIAVLFYILTGKMYEYQYAWANISDDLPMEYVFSAFWKEQQGSFLLWSFWHIVLAVVIMLRGGRWETPVLAVVALAEAIIASMILGLYFGGFRLGANPFDLLREVMDAPIFAQADYLSKIKGNGLNPLLQNYWMTIHPPTLFLGFASTVVPFGYAVAGLWTREHTEWLKPALKWALFSGAILGLGILMGGAWAYEALSFAGYWAWDPVENASLVPWIVMVAGIHTNLIARNTGYSIRSTYGFYLISFLLILYSTYLTRSGILGDTSAHAFTEMGLGFQLILFIALFSVFPLVLYLTRYKGIPGKKVEEATNAREFWMFIGALVLFFSAILITGATSLPVWNKIVQIFNPDYVGAALKDPIAHHNRYQLWIAVFMGMLSGVAQLMRYRERNWATYAKKFATHMAIATVGAVVLTFLNALWINVQAWQLFALLFAAMFTITANADYLIRVLKGNLKLGASAVSHVGFGILLLGIMSTGLNKEWVSSNSFAMEGLIEGAGEDAINKNVLLLKNAPMPMRSGYEAMYVKDTVVRQTRTFSVEFQKRDTLGNYTGEKFVLSPNVMYDREFTKVVASNPSTKHYWNRDIFTHVSSLPKAELDPAFAKQQDDSLKYLPYEAILGDTIFTKKHYLVLESISKTPEHHDYTPQKGDMAMGLRMRAYDIEGDPEGHAAEPMMYLRPGAGAFALPSHVGQLSMKVRLTEKSMEQMLVLEEKLDFKKFPLKEGQEFAFGNYQMRFTGVDRNINHPNYEAQEGDIAIAALVEVTQSDGSKVSAKPVYLIRGNQPFSLKDELPDLGLHFRFENIDPKDGTITIGVAEADESMRKIPIEIAENAARSDYIVLEAILFPGINYVWLGSLMMLFGLALGLVFRLGKTASR